MSRSPANSRSSFIPVADRLLQSTGRIADKGYRAFAKQNAGVTDYWAKYEEVYLYAYDSVSAARQGLERYITKYNQIRPHSSLDRMTPDEFYFNNLLPYPKAA